MEYDIISWLPIHLRPVREYQRISEAFNPTLKAHWEAMTSAENDMYIGTMSESMLTIWEGILGIESTPESSLEDRRQQLRGFFASDLPYTEKKLREILNASFGSASAYRMQIDRSARKLTLRVGLSNAMALQIATDIIRRVVPANMVLDISIAYNRHDKLANYTHGQLAAYTHEQLRSAELEG